MSKYHSRVPILNQTEYFLHRQETGVIGPTADDKSAPLHQKPLPATSHRTEMQVSPDVEDQGFLVFEQTSDNGQGMRVHQSKSKML